MDRDKKTGRKENSTFGLIEQGGLKSHSLRLPVPTRPTPRPHVHNHASPGVAIVARRLLALLLLTWLSPTYLYSSPSTPPLSLLSLSSPYPILSHGAVLLSSIPLPPPFITQPADSQPFIGSQFAQLAANLLLSLPRPIRFLPASNQPPLFTVAEARQHPVETANSFSRLPLHFPIFLQIFLVQHHRKVPLFFDIVPDVIITTLSFCLPSTAGPTRFFFFTIPFASPLSFSPLFQPTRNTHP